MADLTVPADEDGHRQLVAFAGGRDIEREWAIEDCRNRSRHLEAALLRVGERVVRVPPKLMSGVRKSARTFGKSDAIDALAVARAALREPNLPVAQLAKPEREIALLLDHRANLVVERTRVQSRVRWLLFDLDPTIKLAGRSLDNYVVLDRLKRRLAKQDTEHHPRARPALGVYATVKQAAARNTGCSPSWSGFTSLGLFLISDAA